MGVGDISCAAGGEYAHHCVVEPDADFQQCGAPDRVDPERPTDAVADLLRERLVHQGEEGFRPRRRQFVHRQKVNHQAELLLRDAAKLRVIRVLRKYSVDLDQACDVLHYAGREPLSDEVIVPLHEHEGDHRLQEHHGRYDDQQRARKETLRHHAFHSHGGAFVKFVAAAG